MKQFHSNTGTFEWSNLRQPFVPTVYRVLAECLKTCKSLHLGPSLHAETKAHMFPCSSVARHPRLAHMAARSSSPYFLVQWPTVTWPRSLWERVRLRPVIGCIPWKLIDVLIQGSPCSWLPSQATSATVSG